MALPKVTKTITIESPAGHQRLYHGTLAMHATSVAQGIDFTKSGGAFWAALDPAIAYRFAELAEQQLLFVAGTPGQAVVSFDISLAVMDNLMSESPPWVLETSEGYKFTSMCGSGLNESITNVEITFLL